MNDKKDRHTVWLTPAAWDMVESHYHADNCSTKNEYIEKAVRFYKGQRRDQIGRYAPHTAEVRLTWSG